MNTKHRNQTIDVLRLVFSLCIIGIHLNLFKDMNTGLFRIFTEGVFRIGVPFYFITSGYFYAVKLHDRETTDKYLLRLFRIYVIFEAVDLLARFLPGREKPPWFMLLRSFTTGQNQIYWYIISLILTCAVCRRAWKRGWAKYLIAAGGVLYLFAMTFVSYSWLFPKPFLADIVRIHKVVWAWPQAGFNESILFLSIGVWLRQNNIRSKHAGIGVLVFTAALLAESWFCQSKGAADANCCLSLIPVSVCVFLWALNHPDTIHIPHAGKMSLYVYMIHPYTNYLSYMMSNVSVVRYLISAGLSVICAFLIVMQRNKAEV